MEKIKVEFKKNIIEGLLILETKDFICIKISGGYNCNLLKKDIKILSRENIKKNEKTNEDFNFENDKNERSKILFIHTGGTIASKIDYTTGAVSNKFNPKELLSLYPEISKKTSFDIEFAFNISSEDLEFKDVNIILKILENNLNKKKYEGVIIGLGTDMIPFMSNLLFYSIENLYCPVLIVGAQRSSDRASSDAFSNLNSAIDFINFNLENSKKYNRVGICLHKTLNDFDFNIVDCINSKKLHSSRRDAFKQINYSSFCDITYENEKPLFQIKREDLLCEEKQKNEKIKINLYNENLKIGFLKHHINLSKEEILNFVDFDCIIIEGTGFGHISKNSLEHLKTLKNKGVKLIITTQCIFGEVNLDVYSNGKELKELVFGDKLNLNYETLFSKSVFILSKYKKEDFEKHFGENLEGFEIINNEF